MTTATNFTFTRRALAGLGLGLAPFACLYYNT